MRELRTSLIQLFQQTWDAVDTPPRVKASMICGSLALLSKRPGQHYGVFCRLLTSGNLHRHMIIVHCPDKAFYPDAVRMYLQKHHIHPIQQQSILFSSTDEGSHKLVTAEIDKHHSELLLIIHLPAATTENIQGITQDIEHILQGVSQSTLDFPTMRSELERIAIYLGNDDAESAALLQWIINDHYLFFGIYYPHKVHKNRGICKNRKLLSWLLPSSHEALNQVPELTEIGMHWLHLPAMFKHLYSVSNISALHIGWQEGEQLCTIILIGHFSRGARYINASELPQLQSYWHAMVNDASLPQSAFYKREIRTLFDRAPKVLLHSVPVAQWLKPFKAIVDLQSPVQVVAERLSPTCGNIEYLFVAVDKNRFGSNIWLKMQKKMAELQVQLLGHESYTVGSVQLIFIAVQVDIWPSMDRIQHAVSQCITFWIDRARQGILQATMAPALLHDALLEVSHSTRLYQDNFPPEQFEHDLRAREQMRQDGHTQVRLSLFQDAEVQSIEVHVLMAAVMPLGVMTEKLNAFALVTMEQLLVPLHHEQQEMYIFRFRCQVPKQLHIEGFSRLSCGIQSIFNHLSDHDPLNALIIYCGLNIRDVTVLITLRNYLAQLMLGVSIAGLSEMMVKHHEVSLCLYRIFEAKHRVSMPMSAFEQTKLNFNKAMLDVQSLKEDTWFRALLAIILASLRSNAWARKDGQALAIKIDSSQLGFIAEPYPYREIFVHGVFVEGVHLRAGAVARGGLRFSDRPLDFRTEVLELMITQVVKNGQIVPTGAKGGFVVRDGVGESFVLEQYHQFIRGLLSITDNLEQGKLVLPQDVRVPEQDRDDTYLVVAADKGTARYSDDANAEALAANFWLGDAFASGGSHGYDHKVFGITARGAWECAAHHFARLGKNLWLDEVSVVGIGDMSGDVFGNGMLLNPNLKLVAAFNHLHIFLDPYPDVGVAYQERLRLFTAVKGWGDYHAELISEGGGVFNRAAKSVQLSEDVQTILGIKQDACSGEALIRAILQAPVDLLYNGGIGTYVKACSETDLDAQDPANNAVRVDAISLRCKVLSEGGNLGLTRAARIEYAQHQGVINTDAIDNAAGVNMSDHEVNLKILLADEPFKLRNKLLRSVAEAVVTQCLNDNKEQAIALSLAKFTAEHHLPRLQGLQQKLYEEHYLLSYETDITFFALRPVLAEWLGHEKNRVHQALDTARFRELSIFGDIFLQTYFPMPLRKKYAVHILNHPLANDIAHTRISSYILNRFGLTSIHYLQSLTSATVTDIVQALLIADVLLGTKQAYDILFTQADADVLSWYQAQQRTLSFAEGLLVSHDHMGIDENWIRATRKSLHAYTTQHGITNAQLAALVTAIPLAEQVNKPLIKCLEATQQCLDVLPFSLLETALRTPLWANTDAHALRCEWLQRLILMKIQAAERLLQQTARKREVVLEQWRNHPLQDKFSQLLDEDSEQSQEEKRLRYILALTHLQSIVELRPCNERSIKC